MNSEYLANLELVKEAPANAQAESEQLFNERKPVKFDEEEPSGNLADPSSWSIV